MADVAEKKLSRAAVAELRQLRLEAMNLQAIEGNPLDAEDIAMFEMFEREGWTAEQRRAHINALAEKPAKKWATTPMSTPARASSEIVSI